jgi:phasin family protein
LQQKSLAINKGIPTIQIMLQRSKENREQQCHRQRGVPEQPFNYQPSINSRSMNMLTAEQIVAAQKSNIETLFGLTQKAFEGVEKLVELNVQATKAAMAEAANNTQAVLSVKDAQELLTLQASLMQPLAEKTVAYSRHLYDIASGTGAEFNKAAEAQAADAQKKFMSVVDNAAKNAPAGSETAVAVMKSAVSAASNAMESVQKAVKQATEMAETNFNTVAAQAVSASKAPAKKR